MFANLAKMLYFLALISLNTVSVMAKRTCMESLYESVVNAQETMKDIASNVNIGLKSLSKSIKFVEKFVDSTIEEDCDFYCKADEAPFPRDNHVPSVNGCGSLGLHFTEDDLPRPEMVECCNSHDACYDTCGSDKEDCDRHFKRCLYGVCNTNKEQMNVLRFKLCQGGAKLLYTGTLALGCTSFKESQESACVCMNIKTNTKHNEL